MHQPILPPPLPPLPLSLPSGQQQPQQQHTLTPEQLENRMAKMAQLEKIQSTLSKSKSASTPGAAAVATGAVLHQKQQQQQLQQQQVRLQQAQKFQHSGKPNLVFYALSLSIDTNFNLPPLNFYQTSYFSHLCCYTLPNNYYSGQLIPR
ncbi:unnamed protein product [Protopolystoma xenopodis]|uniref:Uncharacterized protein n=1 Tax=Protopolystoma xenopodis TaxID=117903 RepID=A0A3S5BN10_9PLAT|nr:unnamed protein product [Protopolystoma xenopodis]